MCPNILKMIPHNIIINVYSAFSENEMQKLTFPLKVMNQVTIVNLQLQNMKK